MTDYEDREHGAPFDMPSALAILQRIAKPLRGGRAQERSRAAYLKPTSVSLKAALRAADRLIARRLAAEQHA